MFCENRILLIQIFLVYLQRLTSGSRLTNEYIVPYLMIKIINMEEKVLTIEQCRKLIELGVNMSDASLMWDMDPYDSKDEYELTFSNAIMMESDRYIPTYTLQDIIENLPLETIIEHVSRGYYECRCTYHVKNSYNIHVEITGGKTSLEAAYNALVFKYTYEKDTF